ncbi:MAG: glycosyltransferase [Phycisphaeraceae bacterium]
MRVTIAIATWNRAELLRLTLPTLAAARVPDGVQARIIVCDNNSTDATRQVVDEAARASAAAGGLAISYVHEAAQGLSHARNHLIDAADGDWVLFVDDDVKVEPDWLAHYVSGIAAHPEAAIFGGPILPWLQEQPGRTGQYLIQHYPNVLGILRLDRDTPMSPLVTAYGGNMMYRRDLLAVHRFDPRRGVSGGRRGVAEEVVLINTLLAEGHPGWLLCDTPVYHHIGGDELGLRRFCRWHTGVGRNWRVERGAPRRGRLGVAWWAWRELARRLVGAALRWRPWPTRAFFDAACEAAQYWGYVRG